IPLPQMVITRKLKPAGMKGPQGGKPGVARHTTASVRNDEPGMAEKFQLHGLSINGRGGHNQGTHVRIRRMVKVKICGNVTLKDTMAAVEAGADAVGFVFYAKSPRAVSPNAVAAIVSHLPPFVTPVGLFVNE